MQTLNIAVVGAGLIGRKHIALVAASARCSLLAIADPDEQTSSLAERMGTHWCSSLDEVLAIGDLHGVILATPNQLHYPQAMKCATAGIPLLIEKPVTQSVDEARQLAEFVSKQSSRVLVGHHRMHSDIMRSAKSAVDSGVIGDVVAVQGAALFYKPDDYFEAGPWRTKAGGGPILINMIHEIGNLRYLCGEITRVAALPSSARRGFEVEDTVGIILQFENGAIGTFILSDTAASCKSWEQTTRENTDYHHDPKENCYHIAGTAGSLSIPTMTLHTFANKASWWSPMVSEQQPVAVNNPLERQLSHFCDVISGDAEPLVSVFDGMRNLEVTEEIVQACRAAGTIKS